MLVQYFLQQPGNDYARGISLDPRPHIKIRIFEHLAENEAIENMPRIREDGIAYGVPNGTKCHQTIFIAHPIYILYRTSYMYTEPPIYI